MVGTTISHYKVLRELGRGGMGIVYLAEDTWLSRKVAMKCLPTDVARDESRRKRFEQEARAAAALNHPGIAQVFEFEADSDDLYIVFEYIEGPDLRAKIGVPMPTDELTRIATRLSEALVSAHARGIVHRDLKPENVMFTSAGEPKILDFGLARLTMQTETEHTASIALTQAGTIIGTVGYMSPEQLECKEVDHRSDIFSLGVILYELATGVHPFRGESSASTIARILTQEPPTLSSANPISPPQLDRIVSKCLRKRREERYQSTPDLLVDLEDLRRGKLPALTPHPEISNLRLFWWQHLMTMLTTTPLIIWLIYHARLQMPDNIGGPLNFIETLAIALNWSVRFVLVSVAIFNRKGLPGEARRLNPWIGWTDWVIIAGLLAIAAVLFNKNEILATIIGAMSMGGVASKVMIEPAVMRSIFGEHHND